MNILVGVHGGLYSLITAILLHKQGNKVTAVAIDFLSETEESQNSQEFYEIFENYTIGNISEIKKTLAKFHIPFYLVKAQHEFYTEIRDQVVAMRLMGLDFPVNAYYNKLLITILKKEAKSLEIARIATGHVANISLGHPKYITEAKDLEFEQSYELSLINSNELYNIEFPLGELKHFEIVKIADSLGITGLKKSHYQYRIQIMEHKKLPSFVEKHTPISLRKIGDIYDYTKDLSLGVHNGIHNYRIGQKINSELQVIRIDSYSGHVFVDSHKKLKTTHLFLNKANLVRGADYSRPYNVSIRIGRDTPEFLAQVYFKNNDCILIELKNEYNGQFAEGLLVIFYQGKKVLGAGHVRYAGIFLPDKIKLYPVREHENEHEHNDEENKNTKARKYSHFDYWY